MALDRFGLSVFRTELERVDAIGVEYSTGFDYLMKYVLRKYAFHGSDFFSLQGL